MVCQVDGWDGHWGSYRPEICLKQLLNTGFDIFTENIFAEAGRDTLRWSLPLNVGTFTIDPENIKAVLSTNFNDYSWEDDMNVTFLCFCRSVVTNYATHFICVALIIFHSSCERRSSRQENLISATLPQKQVSILTPIVSFSNSEVNS